MRCDLLYTLVGLLFIVGWRGVLGDNAEDSWIEPNSWGSEMFTLEEKVDNGAFVGAKMEDNQVALTYYKKFIAALFNPKKLKFNEATSLYHRSMIFTLNSEQLEKLQKLNDPRDLDVILTDILSNLRIPKPTDFTSDNSSNENGINAILYGDGDDDEPNVWALVKNIFVELKQLSKISEIQFLLLVVAFFIFCWYVHRRYHIGYITLIAATMFLFGYIMTYLECNHELEVKQMKEVLEMNKEAQPKQTSWPMNWFSKSEEVKHHEHILKAKQLRLPFCRPDHVFILYINDIFLKYMEFLIEKFSTTIITFNGNLSFPFNYLAPLLLILMIAYFSKLVFKYILSPRAWASLIHHLPSKNANHGTSSNNGDRLSGDNLRIFLNAVNNVSGVQEVVENSDRAPPLASAIDNTSQTNSTSASAETKNNNKVEMIDLKEEEPNEAEKL